MKNLEQKVADNEELKSRLFTIEEKVDKISIKFSRLDKYTEVDHYIYIQICIRDENYCKDTQKEREKEHSVRVCAVKKADLYQIV